MTDRLQVTGAVREFGPDAGLFGPDAGLFGLDR
jgi:hypothetical protein